MDSTRFKEVVSFFSIGLVASVLDYALFNVLTILTSIPIVAGNLVSASLSSYVGYKLNKRVVFEDRMHGRRKTLVLYTLIIAGGIVIVQSLGIYIIGVSFDDALAEMIRPVIEALGWEGVKQSVLTNNIAKVIATFFSALWNYFLLRRFVFITSEDAARANGKSHDK